MPVLNVRGASSALADLDAALALVDADPDARALASGAPDEVQVDSPLANWLYAAWWSASSAAGTPSAGDEPLAGVLEAARRSVAPLEEGWLVLASDGVRIVCARVRRLTGGAPALAQRAADAVVASSRPGCAARPGDMVTLFAGSGGPDPDDGWWWAHTGEPGASGPVDRWYVHARPEGAAAVVAATVARASKVGVAVSLKCPTRASGFGRQDALVVYVPRPDRAAWERVVPAWLGEIAPHVAEGAPPMTRLVAPGVGFAEDAGGAISLGQLRCAQVAAAVVRLRREPPAGAARRRAVLAGVGIDPDRPEVLS